jgi:hypothetical protein
MHSVGRQLPRPVGQGLAGLAYCMVVDPVVVIPQVILLVAAQFVSSGVLEDLSHLMQHKVKHVAYSSTL